MLDPRFKDRFTHTFGRFDYDFELVTVKKKNPARSWWQFQKPKYIYVTEYRLPTPKHVNCKCSVI